MITDILQEGVLNDDYIIYPEQGKVFKGNYIAIVVEYRYATAWSNSEHTRKFRSEFQLNKHLKKHYPNY